MTPVVASTVAVCALVGLAGCAPDIENDWFTCDPSMGHGCPDGFVCDEGRCVTQPGGDVDGGLPPEDDAGAPVDGGGAADAGRPDAGGGDCSASSGCPDAMICCGSRCVACASCDDPACAGCGATSGDCGPCAQCTEGGLCAPLLDGAACTLPDLWCARAQCQRESGSMGPLQCIPSPECASGGSLSGTPGVNCDTDTGMMCGSCGGRGEPCCISYTPYFDRLPCEDSGFSVCPPEGRCP